MRHFAVDAEVVNVSKRGSISIECGEKLERGKTYAVRLLFSGVAIDVECKVVWTHDDVSRQKNRSLMKFEQIDNNRVDALMAFIEENKIDTSGGLHSERRPRALVSYPSMNHSRQGDIE